jgi:predicted alpha/beta-hydrolase family hydrolase
MTRGPSQVCCKRQGKRASALCWRMVREPAWRTRSWPRSRTDLRCAASPVCAINSPYMEQGSKRPDAPKLAQATVRAAIREASRLVPRLALVAGGKSFGGRMTSQAQAASPLPGVRGLVFLGFPLHAAGRPSDERGEHLFEIAVPMLFLQGTRDALADVTLMQRLTQELGPATIKLFPDADHSFHVPARSGRKDAEIKDKLLDALAEWIETVAVRRPESGPTS